MYRLVIAGLLVSLCWVSCESKDDASEHYPAVAAALKLDLDELSNYSNVNYPVHYDAAVLANFNNTPVDNPTTDVGATLGRVLFYDKSLSINGTVACASCHVRGEGFTDTSRFSKGFSGSEFTTAHSMRLGNAVTYAGAKMFWDGRAASLEAQASQPIQNSVEMGFDEAHGGLDSLFKRMNALAYYNELFAFVYGDTIITEGRIQKAIAQFVRSMFSTHSRWDAGYAQVYNAQVPNKGLNLDVPGLTEEENRGRDLFITPPPQGAGCAGCHIPPTFSLASDSKSNGLDAGETKIFKSPSLKNVGVSGPFMHDGRFRTLEEVIEHYNSGVQLGPALDNKLKVPGGNPLHLNLSVSDKAALVAFLKTLTDTHLNSDSKFGDPFR